MLLPCSTTVDGMDIIKSKEKVRRVIGMVPQEIALYPFLSAEENVKFFASLYGLRGKELILIPFIIIDKYREK